MVKKIESGVEFKQCMDTPVYCLVAFYAQWNGMWQTMDRKLEQLSNTYGNSSINFFKVDVDELQDIAAESGVSALPTHLVFSWGHVIDQFIGTSDVKLESFVRKYHNVPLPPKPQDLGPSRPGYGMDS